MNATSITRTRASSGVAPYDLHGAALLDCYRGDDQATLLVYQDGERDDVPAAFWLRETLDPLEAMALDHCRGRVLDLGAGSGLHAIELERRGFDVVAVDISPACVVIMRERGVTDARVADLYDFADGRFDTIACLCNGLDKVGRLTDLPYFLDRMRTLLAPGGQLLADSFDLGAAADPKDRARIEARQKQGRYVGELDLQFEYRGTKSDIFPVLHVDRETLGITAAAAGWSTTILSSRGGHYLARLEPR
ncbi:SAM-dependent methyltransferase [Sphingopyxis sp. OAS728]|uniref:class I SAM-dependent methyltransferase n=1 Tax=Sphingopyxis sp. OAS728 TaxID=2663823 RepID=UPI00178B9E95|nr:class I SAM-dependent methyltransferase [Sphingopyxis sp. OAS728]MBE1527958.1 SAM-dependent methyltransferase [Sphingopyxis sp. OAS728]